MRRTIPAFLLASAAALAAGSSALAQGHAQTLLRRTPAPLEDPYACEASIDCRPELAGGAPSRPVRVWSVRSSRAPADAELQPYVPIAVFADVDVDKPPRRHRRPRR